MSDLIAAVQAFLDAEEWAYETHPDGDAVRMRFLGESGEWLLVAQETGEDGGKLVVYSLPEEPVPADRLGAVAEAVCRINYGLILGCWELDLRDGELRYRTGGDFRGGEATPEQIGHLIFTSALMTDRYLPALRAVAFDGVDPADAVEEEEDDD